MVLEEDQQLGGTWARRYDRLHLHTIRGFSGLAHYSIPRRYSRYLSREEFVAYLAEYARQLDLRVVTGCRVRKVRVESDGPYSWSAVTDKGEWHSRVMIIAAGQYRTPVVPNWGGRETYRGDLVHSSRYANALPYVGKRVLVVGAGTVAPRSPPTLQRMVPRSLQSASAHRLPSFRAIRSGCPFSAQEFS